MDIESLATSAVRKSIAQTDILESYVNEKDREPSWDGRIAIYRDKSKSKEGMKIVPIQVKGKVKDFGRIPGDASYRVSLVDLDNWLRDGGVILFVVFLNSSGDQSIIYYRGLLPVLIRKLKRESAGKKYLNIPLKPFPQNNDDKVSILLNFYMNLKMQTSFAGVPLYTSDELSKRGLLESLSFSVTALGKGNDWDFAQFLFSDDTYLYANIKGAAIPQPVSEIPCITDFFRDVSGNVSVNERVFFSTYRVSYNKYGKTFLLGKSLAICFSQNENEGKLTYKPTGTLSDYIKDTECFAAIVQAGHLVAGTEKIKFSGMEQVNLAVICRRLDVYCKIQKMLKKLGVDKELIPSELSAKDIKNTPVLLETVLQESPVRISSWNDNLVYGRYKYANLNILIWAERNGEEYTINSFFDRHIISLIEELNDGTQNAYPITHYVLLQREDFIEADNIDYERIKEEICENDSSVAVQERITMFLLELLFAYDVKKDNRIIDLAERYSEWLEAHNFDPVYRDVLQINRIQIIKRKRDLGKDELDILHNLRKSAQSLEIKCAANILLERNDSAQDCFNEMVEDQKRAFLGYPICNLGKIQYR